MTSKPTKITGRKRVVLLLASLISLGCSTNKVFDLEGKPSQFTPEVAVIRTYGNLSFVQKINDTKVRGKGFESVGKIIVPPGPVTVFLIYTPGPGPAGPPSPGISAVYAPGPASKTIGFVAEAGCEYEIGYPTFWIGRKPYVQNITKKKDLLDYTINGKHANPATTQPTTPPSEPSN